MIAVSISMYTLRCPKCHSINARVIGDGPIVRGGPWFLKCSACNDEFEVELDQSDSDGKRLKAKTVQDPRPISKLGIGSN